MDAGKPEGLNPRELDFLLMRTHHTHKKMMMHRLQSSGITRGQPPVLDYLHEHDGCIQNELARSCRLEPATITGILSNMERDGLVERRQNPEDRRALRIFLTEKGRALCRIMDDAHAQNVETCFAGMTPDERKTAEALLLKMQDNMMQYIQNQWEDNE